MKFRIYMNDRLNCEHAGEPMRDHTRRLFDRSVQAFPAKAWRIVERDADGRETLIAEHNPA